MFANLRAPYFASIYPSKVDGYASESGTIDVASKKGLYLNRKRSETTLDMSLKEQNHPWIEGELVLQATPSNYINKGERHAAIVCIKNPLGARIAVVSARLDIRGTECVMHHVFFDSVLLGVSETTSFSLDATPLRRGAELRLFGVSFSLIVIHANSFMSQSCAVHFT